jgi:hypothetical protein
MTLSLPPTKLAKPKARSDGRPGPYHRLRDSNYGSSASSSSQADNAAGKASSMKPQEPASAPPIAVMVLEQAKAFKAEQDCNLVLSVELGQEPGSAEKTLVSWVQHSPEITEMLDDQVGCVFQRIPGIMLGAEYAYKTNRGWYWWFYDDCRNIPGVDHSGWYLSNEIWLSMTKEFEVIITYNNLSHHYIAGIQLQNNTNYCLLFRKIKVSF